MAERRSDHLPEPYLAAVPRERKAEVAIQLGGTSFADIGFIAFTHRVLLCVANIRITQK
jgi:hypothetical protein